jgi:Protein of unknown function (DUF2889)
MITARTLRSGAVARLRDGIHDMAVGLEHDGHKITKVRGRASRVPWSTCPEAISQLDAFIGTRLSANSLDVAPGFNKRAQCTHLSDLAHFAFMQLSRQGTRIYRVEVKPAVGYSDGSIEAEIQRNGRQILKWRLIDGGIVEPALFRGYRLDARASLPADCANDDDLFEAIMMLRRATLIFRGRARIGEEMIDAAKLTWMTGVCYTFQPAVIKRAVPAGSGTKAPASGKP